jgi:glycosyltransferase involved in cell wall biosynthesis
MAAGLPIVATDLPAIREVLSDGVNAVLVEPGKLGEGIERALREPWLGERARADAERFTWSGRARAILERVS